MDNFDCFCIADGNNVARAPFTDCPKFKGCSVNDCPLDQVSRSTHPDDPQTECRLSYTKRKRIAEKYGLENMGMTRQELINYKRSQRAKSQWAKRTEQDKIKILDSLIVFTSKHAV